MSPNRPMRHVHRRDILAGLALVAPLALLAACGQQQADSPGATLREPTTAPTSTPSPSPTATPAPTLAPTPTITATPAPTATPTTMPSPTPTPRPPTATAVRTALVADFSQWRTRTEATYRRSYDAATGEYLVELLEADFGDGLAASRAVADCNVSVEVRRVSGPADLYGGLLFRWVEAPLGQFENDRYVFAVSPAGSFALFRQYSHRPSVAIIDWKAAPGIIKPGDASNLLRAICQGPEIRLLINGQEVAVLPDAELTQAGLIGIYTRSAPKAGNPTKVAYKNIRAVAP